jgi:mannosyltransferase OCH1-like enzyme
MASLIISNKLYDIPFNIERKLKETPTLISGVPLIIYQSWHSNKVPEKMKDNIYKLLEVNPEFDYSLYSDEKCREFIDNNYPKDVVNAFDMLIPGAYKSDLWRYCILYKLGGVYLDIKYYSVSIAAAQ